MKSSGDPDKRTSDFGRWGLGISLAGGVGCCCCSVAAPGDSVAIRERKLGIGKDAGEGEAWKVAPAKAGSMTDLEPPDKCVGVGRV